MSSRTHRPRLRLLRSALLALGVGAAAGAAPTPEPHEALEQRIIEVSERLQPLVVHIDAIVRINDRRDSVTASGLIASKDGLVLTNHHVVHRADKVEVHVPGRKAPYPARVLGSDSQTDIALLRITPGEPLPEPVFGRADDVRVGQWVLAIGNPYGLEGTVSLGIVSAKGRNLDVPDLLNDFIQTDAMIDRGSSGGPLVDLEGRVIGLNSRGQGRGIGFTIPIDIVLQVQKQIAEGGVERGWIGVTLQPLSRDLAAYFGIPNADGVIVNGVSPGSPAARAKLAPGDVITHFEGKPVEAEQEEDLGDFQRRVAAVPPGHEVELKLLRDGKAREVKVELGSQPTVQPEESETGFGFHVQEITEKLFREQRLASREGAYVSFVARGSEASEAGLFPGDIVERIDDRRVRDLGELRSALEGVGEKTSFLITARRGGDLKFLLVKRGGQPDAPADAADEAGEAVHRP